MLWQKVGEKVKRCPICGAPIETEAKYCWNCGAKLT
jgi:predicted amidophosphoribosyltransferase